ncbi:MAG: cytochrome B [Planctomycetes bacterium RBG_16_59_8]|nr:MAG: cytochrome B [Planctomycetes bacterium RBG_16_59_8]
MVTRNPLKRLYRWVIGWSCHPGGVWALFFIAFAEASFFPIPPDVLLIALALGMPRRSWWYATVCSVGSVLGAVAGYLIGWFLWSQGDQFFFTYVFSEKQFEAVKNLYQQNAFLAVFGAAFTPIPFKVFTIVGGVCRVDFATFIVASIAGRSLRFFMEGAAFFWFGAQARLFIEKYFNWVALGFFLLLIGGFLTLAYLI